MILAASLPLSKHPLIQTSNSPPCLLSSSAVVELQQSACSIQLSYVVLPPGHPTRSSFSLNITETMDIDQQGSAVASAMGGAAAAASHVPPEARGGDGTRIDRSYAPQALDGVGPGPESRGRGSGQRNWDMCGRGMRGVGGNHVRGRGGNRGALIAGGGRCFQGMHEGPFGGFHGPSGGPTGDWPARGGRHSCHFYPDQVKADGHVISFMEMLEM